MDAELDPIGQAENPPANPPVLSPARRRLLKGGLVALGLVYTRPVVEVIHPTPALASSTDGWGGWKDWDPKDWDREDWWNWWNWWNRRSR